jgi:high affinity Mn2+ porin
MALTDYVDGNSLSHDGRTQFLNWTLGTQGAYDFAADNKAYTQGLVLEYITSGWKFRYAFAQLSTQANGPEFNYDLSTAHHQVIEVEKELSLIPNRSGALRVLVYEGVNKYGNFREAMEEDQILPLSETHNRVRTKHGIGVNFEQYITDNSGFYARASMNDGKTEAWSYTEVDRSATAGFSIEGQSWRRPNDKFGIGGGVNAISKSHADYLKAGGTGIILGDGKLRYGNEGVFETFYSFQYNSNLWLTADYQFAVNPGYNKDRGPIWNIVALRVHIEI